MIAETINASGDFAGLPPCGQICEGLESVAEAAATSAVAARPETVGPRLVRSDATVAADKSNPAVDLRAYLEAVIAAAVAPYRQEIERLQAATSAQAEQIGQLRAQLEVSESRLAESDSALVKLQSTADDSQRHRLELERLRAELATARFRLLAAEHRVQELRREQSNHQQQQQQKAAPSSRWQWPFRGKS